MGVWRFWGGRLRVTPPISGVHGNVIGVIVTLFLFESTLQILEQSVVEEGWQLCFAAAKHLMRRAFVILQVNGAAALHGSFTQTLEAYV